MSSRHDPARTELSEPTRLLESDASETAHLREALRTLGPTRVDDVTKARVRRSLEREARTTKKTWLVPVLAVGLLLATAVAGASMPSVRKHLPFVESGADTSPSHPEKSPTKPTIAMAAVPPNGSAPEPLTGPSPATPIETAPPAPESPQVAPTVVPAVAPAVPAAPPAIARTKPVVHAGTSAPGIVTPAPMAALSASASASAERPEPPQGGELVMGAMRALRRENDAAKASRLLGDYRRTYATGPLDEEALALAIEAGLRLGDGSARAHARTYLDRYPRGRFTATAESALAP